MKIKYASFSDNELDNDFIKLENNNDSYNLFYIIRKGKNFNIYINKDNMNLADDSGNSIEIYSNELFVKNLEKKYKIKKCFLQNKYNIYYKDDYNHYTQSNLNIVKRENSWILSSKLNEYIGIIYNNNKKTIKKIKPNTVEILLPNNLYDFTNKKNLLERFKTRDFEDIKLHCSQKSRYNNKKKCYQMFFFMSTFIRDFDGIESQKNCKIIDPSNFKKKPEVHFEFLKLDKNLFAVIYKQPFSLMHALAISISRFYNN